VSVVTRAGRVVPDAVSIKSKTARGWAALLVVWVVWGSTYLGIRVAVESMPPLLMAGARFLIAGLVLFPVTARSGRPAKKQWLSCALVGILLLVGGNGALSVAERTVPAGLSSLLIATVPLWLLGIDAVLNRTWLGWLPMAGLAIGLAGVGLLSGTMRGSVPIAGVAVCLCGAVSWAFGTVFARRLPMPGNPALGSAMQMLIAGVVLLCAGGIGGESVHFGAVTGRSWLAFGYLILVGSLIGFSSYIVAVRLLPTSTVATYAYVNPVIAVLLGTTLLGERLSPMMILGGVLIVGAVVLVVGRRKQRGHL
jgi:drug/metabolite transporter (DMT)-like permease